MSDTPAHGGAAHERLGALLRDGRERAGLTTSALAQRTHVRRAYLEALEEGRYGELPEDVYARNFVRLYAQAVGLDPAACLERYARERADALGRSTLEQRLDRDRREAAAVTAAPVARSSAPRSAARAPRERVVPRLPGWVGPGVATVLLVAVVVGLAAWGFDRFFANPLPPTTGSAAGPVPGAASVPAADDPVAPDADAATDPAAVLTGPGEAGDAIVRVDLRTDPPGAEVTVDGFAVPGRTPLEGVPLTARAARVVRAELEGHAPAQTVVDLLADGVVELVLEPLADGGAAAPAGGPGLVLTITDATWLEVYTGGARNQGERLVYTTAQPGATYAFELPVFVYVGNAAGARATLDGQDLGALGGPGAVLGRAFAR